MEADRLNAPLADAGGGRQGQGRGGRGAEVRAAWGAAADPGAEGPGSAAPRIAPAGGGPPQVRPDAGLGYGAARAEPTVLARVISSRPEAMQIQEMINGTWPASGAFVEPGRAGLAQLTPELDRVTREFQCGVYGARMQLWRGAGQCHRGFSAGQQHAMGARIK